MSYFTGAQAQVQAQPRGQDTAEYCGPIELYVEDYSRDMKRNEMCTMLDWNVLLFKRRAIDKAIRWLSLDVSEDDRDNYMYDRFNGCF